MSRINPPFQPRGPRYPQHARVEVSAIATDPTGCRRPLAISPCGEELYHWCPERKIWRANMALNPGNVLTAFTLRCAIDGVRVWRGIFTIKVRL